MNKERKDFFKFAWIVLITIIVTRILVLFFPDKSWYIFGQQVHHFFHGVVLVLIAAMSRFFSRNEELHKFDLYLFGIGTGLIFDEFVFVLLGFDDIKYFSGLSFYSILISVFVLLTLYYLIFLSLLFIFHRFSKKK
ncbi:hypothetical protein J4446_03145 [Candidatus Woesearchaeota archaeon]|nr:hypothetical protein [Candidatus Woesearchaeota archaeon]